MAQQLSETYRGFHVLIEAVPHDSHGVRLRRTITRQLGGRLMAVRERGGTGFSHLASSSESLADALRDAREAIDRLLGGWHPSYTQEPAHTNNAPRVNGPAAETRIGL
ncbi:MAG: DNA-binding protein [Paraburkholderia terricola]